jgi:hypothetical protein
MLNLGATTLPTVHRSRGETQSMMWASVDEKRTDHTKFPTPLKWSIKAERNPRIVVAAEDPRYFQLCRRYLRACLIDHTDKRIRCDIGVQKSYAYNGG